MRLFKLANWCIGFSLLFSQWVLANPVWQVTKGGETVFIGGTIHVLEASDYPLPAAFSNAYRQADRVFFETDIDALSTQAFVQKFLAATTYKNGQTIDQKLSAETLGKLKAYLATQGIPYDAVKGLKPGLLGVQLSQIEMRKLGISVQGVDDYFNGIAKGDNKFRGQLETPEDQIAVIAAMGVGHESELIENALKDLQKIRQDFNDIRDAWRSGSREALNDVTVVPFRNALPVEYKSMVVDRNNKWMPQIEAMFRTSEDELVLVGAMHLVGSDGILQQLEQKGYQVTQLR